MADSSITMRSSPGDAVAVAANSGVGGVKRPVHHSEVVTITSATKTRPNNATPYDAGDLYGAATDVVFDFDLAAKGLQGGGLIIAARLLRKSTASSSVRFRAFVHDADLVTLTDADNAQHPLLWANAPSRCGWIDFSGPITGDAASGNDMLDYQGLLSAVQGIGVSPADHALRVVLTCRDAWTPIAQEEVALQLKLIC
jgi:hypothetical protein